MYNYIIDPTNNKKIDINSYSGYNLLKKYIYSQSYYKNNISTCLQSGGNCNSEEYDATYNPFSIGDECRIMIGTSRVNRKKVKWGPKKINNILGMGRYHSWIEITTKTGCIYSIGVEVGPNNTVLLLSPDSTLQKCKSLVKECIDSQNKKQKYNYTNSSGEVLINIDSDEQDGCNFVCTGIESVYHKEDINNMYPNFLNLKSGKLRYVHIRILDWILSNSIKSTNSQMITVTPFKYDLKSGLIGFNLYRKWKRDDPKALANCQTFASDFLSNPTYIFYKLYNIEYDALVEAEKTILEIKISSYRWRIIRKNLNNLIKIHKSQDNIEKHKKKLEQSSTLVKSVTNKSAKSYHKRNIKDTKKIIKDEKQKMKAYTKDINNVHNMDIIVDKAYLKHLKEERDILKSI